MLSLNEKFRFSLLDIAKGLQTKRYYEFFNESSKWSLEKISHYQNKKLNELITHAYNNILYYKQILKKTGINPSEIKTKKDLLNLPILERDDIVNNFENIIDNKNKYSEVFPSSSSGTTGTPIQYLHDNEGESAGIAAGYCFLHMSGWRLGNKTLHIWGNQQSIKKWKTLNSKLKSKILNRRNYPAFLLNDPKNYPNLLKLIIKINPLYIDGYASSIGSFAYWLKEKDIVLNNIKTVFTTAENLTCLTKEIIESQIGPVSDIYGCGEINGIAVQLINQEKYYILDTHVIAETIENNGVNELVLTDLDNRIMPFIRYKTGDIIDQLTPPNNLDNLPFSSFKKLGGRLADIITLPSGKMIHPVNTLGGTFLRKFPQIRKHRIIWNGHILKFEIECSDSIELLALEREIEENLADYKVDFIIEISDKILPGKSGKFRYVEFE